MISSLVFGRTCRAALISSVLLGSVVFAMATQMFPLSVAQLTERSDTVIRGTVSGKICLEDEQGRVITRIQLNVAEVWKGEPVVGSFTIVQAGGVLGDRRVTVAGQPDFKIGEEVVAFLALNQRGEGVVLGVCQGKFDVFEDASGVRRVRNAFHGGSAAGSGSAQALNNRLGNRRLSLADLKRSVTAREK